MHLGQNVKRALLLKVTSVIGIGEDETRYSEEGGVVTATQCGQRRFTLQIQAHSTEHTDDGWGIAILERIRTRIRRRSSIDRLLSVGVSIIRLEQAIDVSRKMDQRVQSIANMDVILGAVVNEDDPIPAGWIEHVVITSHTEDASGIELPTALQLNEHEIPPIP